MYVEIRLKKMFLYIQILSTYTTGEFIANQFGQRIDEMGFGFKHYVDIRTDGAGSRL